MTIDWIGYGERENEEKYETMSLFVDGTRIGRGSSVGGGLGCVPMVPVFSDPNPPQSVQLQPGTHVLRIDTETGDALYHFGAFYHFDFSFDP